MNEGLFQSLNRTMEYSPGPSTSTGGFTQGGRSKEEISMDEAVVLEGLGEAFDQTQIENEVLEQIDERIRQDERLRQDKQLRDVAEEVK